ncbi:MAG: hypothetical protein AAGI51_08580 [Pseudomonadota bacterium]
MTGIAPFEVAPAGPRLAAALARRTFPRYRPVLARAGSDPRVISLALMEGRSAAGLLLGEMVGGDALLLSVSVATGRRRRGGGAALLSAFEGDARLRGARRLEASWTAPRGEVPPVERLLARAGWSAPAHCGRVYALDAERSLTAPWFTRAQRRLKRWRVQPWTELGDDAALRLIGPASWARADLHPREHVGRGVDGALQLREASAVLRDGHAEDAPAVGWIMVHAASDAEGRVSSGLVRPDLERSFAYGALVAYANRAIIASGRARGSFLVRAEEPRMEAFAERWLTPLAAEIRDSRAAEKPLVPAPSLAVH